MSAPPSGSRVAICLAERLPPPDPGIGFGLAPDMLDFLLQDHGLHKLTPDLPQLPDLLSSAASGWTALPQWNGSDPLQALHLFTDGSFFPHSQQAGWSVVVLGPCSGRIVRIGFLCGTCPGLSAFDGELCALVHARAIALANRPLTVAVASDCTSALQVGFRVCRLWPSGRLSTGISWPCPRVHCPPSVCHAAPHPLPYRLRAQ